MPGNPQLLFNLIPVCNTKYLNTNLSQHDGYIDVDDILSLPGSSGKTVRDIEALVRNDSKGRFEMQTNQGKKQIKATQGHSNQSVTALNLEPISHHTDARTVLHGTPLQNWLSIKTQGLSRRNRNHIHFAPGEQARSGFPPNCDIAIEIDLRRALEDGIKFYRSENDVILSEGDRNGVIGNQYFKRVYNIKTRKEVSMI